MEEKKDLWQIEEKIADILGLEKEATEWRLITRDENNRKIEYTDYTDEVKEICSLIATTRLEAAREERVKVSQEFEQAFSREYCTRIECIDPKEIIQSIKNNV